MQLERHSTIQIRQRHEIGELFGFETRNKYEIRSREGTELGFAAEQQKGIWGLIVRQYLGHWRRFDIHIFDARRVPYLIASHPFRFLFQRLEIRDAGGNFLGALQQRFGFLIRKRFDVEDAQGNVMLTVSSPLWRPWTFPFERHGREVAKIVKKWSGLLSEAFTDKDNFELQFLDPALSKVERDLLLAAAFFVDLQYFERKAKN